MKSHCFQRIAVHRNGTPSRYPKNKRRIAQRQEQAAAVAHHENEEDDRMFDVLSLAVGFQ